MLNDILKEFNGIGISLSSEKDTLKLFEKIINSSMKLTSADAGTMYIVVDKKSGDWSHVRNGSTQGKLLKFAIARNTSMEISLQDFAVPVSKKSVFGFTVISGESLRINDAYVIGDEAEYKHDKSFDLDTGYRTKSVLSIPMKNRDNDITGVIQLINKKKAWDTKIDYLKKNVADELLPFTDEDELIMNSLAGQAAVALENSKLYKDMQSLLQEYKQRNSQLVYLGREIMKAHEEERKRIAREIHDGPAQSVVNLSFVVKLCEKFLADGNMDRLTSEMSGLNGSIHSVVKEIRTIIYDLKPSYLDDGLICAIQNYIETFSVSNNINIEFSYSGEDSSIEYYLTSALFRIVQEALSNVKKHAEAEDIKIKLTIAKACIKLEIADNGKGFDIEKLKTGKFDKLEGGFGLQGIRERVELNRGSMSLYSAPGKGTKLHIEIPLG